MKRIGPFVVLAGLAACDSPSPAFRGSEGVEVAAAGHTYRVHRRDDRVEVYRVGFETLPRRAEVLAGAALAIEQATGCPPRAGTLEGEAAIQRARLACRAAPSPAPAVILVAPRGWRGPP